jgi:hypothetical protein
MQQGTGIAASANLRQAGNPAGPDTRCANITQKNHKVTSFLLIGLRMVLQSRTARRLTGDNLEAGRTQAGNH